MSVGRGGTSERMAQRRLLFFVAVVTVVLGSAETAVGKKKADRNERMYEEDKTYFSGCLCVTTLLMGAVDMTWREEALFDEMVENRAKEWKAFYMSIGWTVAGTGLTITSAVLASTLNVFGAGAAGSGAANSTLNAVGAGAAGSGAASSWWNAIHGPTDQDKFRETADLKRTELCALLQKHKQAEKSQPQGCIKHDGDTCVVRCATTAEIAVQRLMSDTPMTPLGAQQLQLPPQPMTTPTLQRGKEFEGERVTACWKESGDVGC